MRYGQFMQKKESLGSTMDCLREFSDKELTELLEVALIRMTTDGRLSAAQRRGYSNVFNALFRISKEEGVLTLWRGCGPTVVRAMVINAAQLGAYSQAKQWLLHSGHLNDNIYCHLVASMISGFASAVTSLPVDITKTRIQTMDPAKAEYKGALDALVKIARSEGVLSLWKGLTPYYMRLAPYTVLTFVILEQLNRIYFNFVLGVQKGSAGL